MLKNVKNKKMILISSAVFFLAGCKEEPKKSEYHTMIDELSTCLQQKKSESEIKKLFFKNIVDNISIPLIEPFLLGGKEIDTDYFIIRDNSHAPHKKYLHYEEFLNSKGLFMKVEYGSTSARLNKRGFVGTIVAGAPLRLQSSDQVLYQEIISGIRPLGGGTSLFYFDNCGRFIPTYDPKN